MWLPCTHHYIHVYRNTCSLDVVELEWRTCTMICDGMFFSLFWLYRLFLAVGHSPAACHLPLLPSLPHLLRAHPHPSHLNPTAHGRWGHMYGVRGLTAQPLVLHPPVTSICKHSAYFCDRSFCKSLNINFDSWVSGTSVGCHITNCLFSFFRQPAALVLESTGPPGPLQNPPPACLPSPYMGKATPHQLLDSQVHTLWLLASYTIVACQF